MNRIEFNTNVSAVSAPPISKSKERSFSLSKALRVTALALLMLPGAVLGYKDLCQQPNTRYFCDGNLGIPRKDMPQVEGDVREKYLAQKAEQPGGLVVTRVPSHLLVNAQSEINKEMVFNLIREPVKPCDKQILVARNRTHYTIIDGHHTATACKLMNGNQLVAAIKDFGNKVLEELQKLPGVIRYNFDGSKKA